MWQENGIVLCQTESSVQFPAIVSDGQDGAFIVWEDFRNANSDIALQHVSSTGELAFGEAATFICNATNSQSDVEIVPNGDHGAYIIWQDSRLGDYDIYGQYIGQDGSRLWTENGIAINHSENTQLTPAALVDEQGNCFIVWQDKRNHSWGDIYGQVVNTTGELLWPDEGIALATASGLEQDIPVVELISDGNFVTSWRDRRNETDYDIYIQKLNRDEHIVPVYIGDQNNKMSIDYQLVQNYPNPFNSSTLIRYTLAQKNNIELAIYNVLGEKIALLANGTQQAGSYTVNWDASGFSSGIYLCCLRAGNDIKVKRMLYLK